MAGTFAVHGEDFLGPKSLIICSPNRASYLLRTPLCCLQHQICVIFSRLVSISCLHMNLPYRVVKMPASAETGTSASNSVAPSGKSSPPSSRPAPTSFVRGQLQHCVSNCFQELLKALDTRTRTHAEIAASPGGFQPIEPLLPPAIGKMKGRPVLVLDLDATLIDTLHMHERGNRDPDFVYEGESKGRSKSPSPS